MTAERHELADELALGLLEGDDLARAERRVEQEPDLARALGAARDRFLPLDLAVEQVAPAAGTWDAIAARVAAQPPVEGPAVTTPAPANLGRRPRGGLAVAAGLAAAIGLGVILAWPSPASEALVVAVLQAQDGTALALLEDFGGGEVALTPLAASEPGDGESLQVWTKWSEEEGPVSVGLLEDLRQAEFAAPALPDPGAGQLYEITREPAGGSPTGLPTGPILALGLGVDH